LTTEAIGCGKYERVNLKLKGTNVSFKYPELYQYTNDTRITNGQLESGLGLGIPVIYFKDIVIYNPELTLVAIESYESAKSYLSNFIKSIQNSNISPEGNKTKIMEQSTISVAGTHAEQIVLSVKSTLDHPLDPLNPLIIRRIYLSHGGKIWILDIKSSENISIQTKKDFEGIINSFNFKD